MFQEKKSAKPSSPDAVSSLVDRNSRVPLKRKDAPGYYPGYRVLDQQEFWDAATRKLILDRIEDNTPIRFFTPAEAATLQAVVDRILPQDDRVEATRVAILPGIDKRLHMNHIEGYRYDDMPSDQEAYRVAARAIEVMSQQLHGIPFEDLETMQQEKILQSLHDNAPLAAQELWQTLNLKRFWTMLVSDCCAVYYAHPNSWDEIGFGGPAYPRGYMRLEGGEAEPWEVEEQRYEWLAPGNTLSDREQKSDKQESSHHGQASTH